MLQAIRILSIASIGGAAAWLNIGYAPRLWADRSQKCMRTHCTSTLLDVVGLSNQTSAIAPIFLQRQNNRLKIHAVLGNNTLAFYPISDRVENPLDSGLYSNSHCEGFSVPAALKSQDWFALKIASHANKSHLQQIFFAS
jgi:hypothetical protein